MRCTSTHVAYWFGSGYRRTASAASTHGRRREHRPGYAVDLGESGCLGELSTPPTPCSTSICWVRWNSSTTVRERPGREPHGPKRRSAMDADHSHRPPPCRRTIGKTCLRPRSISQINSCGPTGSRTTYSQNCGGATPVYHQSLTAIVDERSAGSSGCARSMRR